MAIRVGLRDAVAHFVVAVGGDEIQAAGDGVLGDGGEPFEGVVAVGGDFSGLVGLGGDASESVVRGRGSCLVGIDDGDLAVQRVVLILRDVLARVFDRGLVAGVVVGKGGHVAERVGERGAASGIVVAVGGGVAVGVDGGADASGGVVVGLGEAIVGVGGLAEALIGVVGVGGGVAGAIGGGEAVVLGVEGGGVGGCVGVGGGGEASHRVVGVAGLAAELVDGDALLADVVVLHLRLGAVGVIGFGEAVGGVVFVVSGDRLRLSVDGAGDGLAQLVVVGVVAVGRDVAQGVGLLHAAAIPAWNCGLTVCTSRTVAQAVRSRTVEWKSFRRFYGRGQVAVAVVDQLSGDRAEQGGVHSRSVCTYRVVWLPRDR